MSIVVRRCLSAHSITPRYFSAPRSNHRLNAEIAFLSGLRDFPCAPSTCGSTPQCAAIIGVSVNETKSETSTAKATVIPNWKKNRPMMPPMNATGTNTATMERVVAMTARKISFVPSPAAAK